MTAFYRWLWHLLPANPIVLRVVKAGSRRQRDLWVRMGYLGFLVLLLFFGLLSGGGMQEGLSLTELAKSGTLVFQVVAYGQVALICLLAPLFVASALNEEHAGETIDILLTTPMSNLQIVLGSLMGRLFFVITLLFSGLPLFAVLLIFGGVPIRSIFVAFGVAALTAVFVGSVAMTIAVLRAGGRKTVFTFIVVVAGYLIVAYAGDWLIRSTRAALAPAAPSVATANEADEFNEDAVAPPPGELDPFIDPDADSFDQTAPDPSTGAQVPAEYQQTTVLTPLHPVLVLQASINTANYRPPRPEDLLGYPGPVRFYLANPLGAFASLTGLSSLVLILFSAIQLRRSGQGESELMRSIRRTLRLPSPSGERRRPPRTVGANPIAWVEAYAQASRFTAIFVRWGFVVIGVAVGLLLLLLYHTESLPALRDANGQVMNQAAVFRWALTTLLLIELAIIVLVGIYTSAGCISKEREDGTLDLLLTTPITPKQYIWGKLRGLVSFQAMMLAVPILTVAAVAIYSIVGHALGWDTARAEYFVMINNDSSYYGSPYGQSAPTPTVVERPLLLPEVALWFPLMLVPFVALCTAIGMGFSVKAKGVLGAVVPSLAIIALLAGFLGFCGLVSSREIAFIGPIINGFSPATNIVMLLNPYENIKDFATPMGEGANRFGLMVAAGASAGVYALIIWTMLHRMVANFDHTVRRLSGAG